MRRTLLNSRWSCGRRGGDGDIGSVRSSEGGHRCVKRIDVR